MTRKTALSHVAPNLSYFNDCKPAFAIKEYKKWVNKIYDDFEKQTCNNCKWYNEPICTASKCEDINELGQYVVRPTFGCNEWEGKIND